MLHEDKAGTLLMPMQLYIDVQMMIKNVYFCITKTKIDNLKGKFWIILIGSDRLEDKFGIVCVMTGNDTSVDILQLGIRLTGTTEVSAIFAQHPEWDRSPRRLKLPALSKAGLDIHKGVDYINPASWCGNMEVANVNLQTCWMLGRCEVDKIPRLRKILARLEAEKNTNLNMLQPFGKDIVRTTRAADDYDDTAEDFHEDTAVLTKTSQSEVPAPDFEDAVVEEREVHKHDPCFEVDGQKVWKDRYLNEHFKEMRKGPGSRDRLKQYADIPRYAIKHCSSNSVVESCVDEMEGPCIQMDFPLTTVAKCDGRIFLCIGEVNDITYNAEHTNRLPVSLLGKSSVTVSFQILFLIPTTTEDDPDLKNDWRWSRQKGSSHKIPGRLMEPLNPDLSMRTPLEPCYLFDSGSLSILGSLLLARLTREDMKVIPQIERSLDFPYTEVNGKACFLCEDKKKEMELLLKKPCPACTPPIDMPENAPVVLEHVGAHILFDTNINQQQQPCGLCLRDSSQCEFYVKKKTGANANIQVQYKRSKCANLMTFSYGHASTSSQSSPCSNVPMPCKWCPSDAPAVWKYNMAVHVRSEHPHVSIADNEALWKLTHAELRDMRKKWSERHNVKATRCGKKKAIAPMVISTAHSSHLVLRSEDAGEGDDEDVGEGDDESEPGSDTCNKTPEEEIDDDTEAGIPCETESAQESKGDPQEEVADNLGNAEDEEAPMEINSMNHNCVEEAVQEELISQIQEKNNKNTSPHIVYQDDNPNANPNTHERPENTDPSIVQGNRQAITMNSENLFTMEAPQTRVGRSRRTHNLAELFVCECGSPVRKENIDGRVNAIQCKKSDCETRWVSKSFCCTVL